PRVLLQRAARARVPLVRRGAPAGAFPGSPLVTLHSLVIDVLVGAGVAGELLCCLGLVLMRNVFDRLHYAMASTAVPPFLIAAAVVVEEDWTQPAIRSGRRWCSACSGSRSESCS